MLPAGNDPTVVAPDDAAPLSDADLIAAHGIGGPASLTDADLVAQHGIQQQNTPFDVLPFSTDPQGGIHFDPTAGIIGSAWRAFQAPGDVVAGRLDPNSPEGRQQAFNLAALISPANPAVRAGDMAIPGILRSTRQADAVAPTAAELGTAAGAGYDAARATGAQYPAQGVADFAQSTQQDLYRNGLIPKIAPNTHAVLDELANPPAGSFSTISDLDAARRALNHIAGDFLHPSEQYAARQVIDRLDKHIADAGAGPGPVAGGAGETLPVPASPGDAGAANGAGAAGVAESPEAAAARLITEARGNAAAEFRSNRISGVEDAADLRAAAANSGQNTGNTLRQRLASLLLSPKQTRGFSEPELDAMRQVVKGTAASNTVRYVSNLLGGGGGIGHTAVMALGGGIGAHLGGEVGAMLGASAASVPSMASRAAYNSMVRRQMSAADDLVRQRSPLFQQRQAAAPVLPNLWDIRAGAVPRVLAPSLIDLLRGDGQPGS